MTIYTVTKDHNEISTKRRYLHSYESMDALLDEYSRRSWINPEVVFSSKNYEEALKEYRQNCSGTADVSIGGDQVVINYYVYSLNECEYDEDGELEQSQTLEEYATPIEYSE